MNRGDRTQAAGSLSQQPRRFGVNLSMTMSIRGVTELVGGRLQFGPMPPLDGNLETIGRILPTCQNVKPRDVVLWCQDQQPRDCFLEEAFARGARGIIAQRRVTPWAGRFSLMVQDTRYVLRRLA